MQSHPYKPPIFIVGVPRSGTTLLAAMLSSHSCLSCGPETRFFHFLAKTNPDLLCESHSWPGEALKFLFATNLVGIPVPEHYKVDSSQIQSYLVQHKPAIPSIISCLTEQAMIRKGKSRWIEKSPEHLKHVYTIRKYFPYSPIIRIVRDPRDVSLSLMKVPWAPSDFLDALMLWRNYDEQSAFFFQNDKNTHTMFYEKLVVSPDIELKNLCNFIGENYESRMLDTSDSFANVVAEKEVWHRIVSKPVDKTRIRLWKKEISREENRIAEALIGDRLKIYGYDNMERLDQVAVVYPSLSTLVRYRKSLASLISDGTRFWKIDSDLQRPLMIYVGHPDRDRWLRFGKPERLFDASHVIIEILKRKLSRQDIYWIRDENDCVKSGVLAWLLTFVLKLLAIHRKV